MSDEIHQLIAALHQSEYQYAAALTGGGSGLAGRLLSVPGGSRTVLEVVVPYSAAALADYLGYSPASCCSSTTSRDMARHACARARSLAPGRPILGFGCTASLRSDRPKRGDHRCHLAVCTTRSRHTWTLTLAKDARSRAEEEAIVELLCLNALAEGAGIVQRVPLSLLPGEEVVSDSACADGSLAAFLGGRGARMCAEVDGRFRADALPPQVLLPGSFNPLHEAHLELARAASLQENAAVAFELSLVNVEKPALPDEEVRRRLAQFAWRSPVWLTRAPTFVEKARLFPGVALVVGADTAERIVALRYYQESAALMAAAFDEFRGLGCRLLVAGRVDASGAYIGLDQIAIPTPYRDLFQEIPFRRDISSTQLRNSSPVREEPREP